MYKYIAITSSVNIQVAFITHILDILNYPPLNLKHAHVHACTHRVTHTYIFICVYVCVCLCACVCVSLKTNYGTRLINACGINLYAGIQFAANERILLSIHGSD